MGVLIMSILFYSYFEVLKVHNFLEFQLWQNFTPTHSLCCDGFVVCYEEITPVTVREYQENACGNLNDQGQIHRLLSQGRGSLTGSLFLQGEVGAPGGQGPPGPVGSAGPSGITLIGVSRKLFHS